MHISTPPSDGCRANFTGTVSGIMAKILRATGKTLGDSRVTLDATNERVSMTTCRRRSVTIFLRSKVQGSPFWESNFRHAVLPSSKLITTNFIYCTIFALVLNQESKEQLLSPIVNGQALKFWRYYLLGYFLCFLCWKQSSSMKEESEKFLRYGW